MQTTLTRHDTHRFGRVATLLAAAFLLLALAGLRPASTALASCGDITFVGNHEELEDAIEAYNAAGSDCEFTIEFYSHIVLEDDLPTINNSNSNTSLRILGDGYALDGAFDNYGLFIDRTPLVIIEDLTIINFVEHGIDSNESELRLLRSTVRGNFDDGINFDDGVLLVVESTIMHNADHGIDVSGDESAPATFTIINSTIVGNFDTGIDVNNYATGVVTHATIADNDIGVFGAGGVVTVNNSILTGNDINCAEQGEVNVTINATLLDSDEDTCGAADGSDGNIVDENPHLLPLGNYGGITMTMMPYSISGGPTLVNPVIDAGNNALSVDAGNVTLENDQRVAPRPQNSIVDMGAVEGFVEFECPTFPATVDSELELFAAILCYNALTTSGVRTINLADDIELSVSLPAIDNDGAGIRLIINGNGNVVDGDFILGLRPFTIAEGSMVDMINMEITNGNAFGHGGGIYNAGDLLLDGVLLVENASNFSGGGLYNSEGAKLQVIDSDFSGNISTLPFGIGGGISNYGLALINDTDFSVNQAEGFYNPMGGGIYNAGEMLLTRSDITSNRAISEFDGSLGGGIANHGIMVVRDSSVRANISLSEYYAFGGGVYTGSMETEDEEDRYTSLFTMINSTISGNFATAQEIGAYGGGLYAVNGYSCCTDEAPEVSVTLIHVTLANNSLIASSDRRGSGAYFDSFEFDFDVTIHNSILAGNLANSFPGDDCYLTVSEGINFVSINSLYESVDDEACGLAAANPDANGNIVGQDPLLDELAFNGGPTPTHALVGNSLAVDSGNNALSLDELGNPLTADQRGFAPRDANGTADMGAYEFGAEEVAPETAVFMSTTKSGTTDDGVAFDNSDILMWDGEEWSLWFEGSNAFLMPNDKPKHNVNAFWIPDPGTSEAIMSFGQNRRHVPNIPFPVDGMDLVRWIGGNGFEFYFDGSDVDLKAKTQEKIDGLHVLPGDEAPDEFAGACIEYLLISTQGKGKVPRAAAFGGGQLKFSGEDVLGFCAMSLGENTTGYWHIVIDGSEVGIPNNATDSISLSDDGETLYLTTKKAVNLGGGVVGGHSTIFAFDIGDGDFSGPKFKAADEGLNRKVDGLQVVGSLDI